MDPAVAEGTFSIDEARAGSTNPGRCAFTPIAAGFRRWYVFTATRYAAEAGFKRRKKDSFTGLLGRS
jgi:hypothetical protein